MLGSVAAPDYVPLPPNRPRVYESPPRREDSWRAQRPGDIPTGQPEGDGFGRQGPDQGYALKLVKQFADLVHLHDGERWEDAAAGCVLVGLKRASLFGRAPVRHDLEIAFRLWGYLDADAPAELVAVRRSAFDRVDNPHHYLEARRLIDAVPDDVLRQLPTRVADRYGRDWRDQLDLDALTGSAAGTH